MALRLITLKFCGYGISFPRPLTHSTTSAKAYKLELIQGLYALNGPGSGRENDKKNGEKMGKMVEKIMEVDDLIWRAGLRRGLRAETIKTYNYAVGKFLRTYHLEPHQVTKQHIEQYLVQLIKWGRAGSTINVCLQALQFFYRNVLGKRILITFPPLRIPRRLPECLSQEEMERFFAAVTGSKHRLITIFTYGSGFRVGEAVNLKVEDLDLTAGVGWIRNGKGGKDRLFIIPERLQASLREWIASHQLKREDWLFSGYQQQHYSDSAVRKIVQQTTIKAGINKKVTPHTLRHSFATHLLENGYSIIEVKELLGHSRLETTMAYAHLARPVLTRIRSPYDTLETAKNQPTA